MSIPNIGSAERARLLQEIERAVALHEEDPSEGDLAAFARIVADWMVLHWDEKGPRSLSAHLSYVWSEQ